MKPSVTTQISRPPADLSAQLAKQGVATIHESMNKTGLMAPRLRPISPGWAIAGPAVTSLNHPGDNLMVHAALSVLQPGDVLVVSTSEPCLCGLIGELIARQAQVHGAAGIVIDSGVRDLAELRELGLPIWSAGVTAAGSAKATPGWVNAPMVCAGININPGDIIVADDDGVVVVPAGNAEEALKASIQRNDKEAESRKRIVEERELSFDRGGMRQYLESQGVRIE